MTAPLIVTATLDPATTRRFEDLRRAHFPPARLVVGAHLTLFHHLPAGEEDAVLAAMREEAAAEPIPGVVSGVRLLGRGVAYDISAPRLVALRARLAARWADRLTAQDRAWSKPHVTVQNKVAPERARALHAQLLDAFSPSPVRVDGLALWRYRGGPWEPAGDVSFTPPTSPP